MKILHYIPSIDRTSGGGGRCIYAAAYGRTGQTCGVIIPIIHVTSAYNISYFNVMSSKKRILSEFQGRYFAFYRSMMPINLHFIRFTFNFAPKFHGVVWTQMQYTRS